MRALPPSRNRRAFPLSGGIGGFVPRQRSFKEGFREGFGEQLVGETPRFDFNQARLRGPVMNLTADQAAQRRTAISAQNLSTERPKTLQDVLGAAGFQMPEKPRYSTQDVAFFGKDPVTGEMRQGGSSDSDYYKQLDAMYAENPEALEIAKQFEADRVAKANQGPLKTLGSQLRPERGQQSLLGSQPLGNSVSPLQQSFNREMNSPQYQSALQRYEQSRGQDQGALSQLQASQARMQQQQDAMLAMPSGPPQFAPPQQNPQPMFSQQDMSGMMRMMMQMFQQMMQGGMGQGSFNSGAFNNAPRSFYPQPNVMPQQSYAMPQQSYAPPPPRYRPARPPPYQRRQPTNFSGSPFGGY